MAQATIKRDGESPLARLLRRALREGALFVFAVLAIWLALSLLTYDPTDPGWSHSHETAMVANMGGVAGAFFADLFLYLFGYMAWLFPLLVAWWGWALFTLRREAVVDAEVEAVPESAGDALVALLLVRLIGFVLTLTAGTGLAGLHHPEPAMAMPMAGGGILGDVVGSGMVGLVDFLGATLFLLALFLTGLTLLTGLSWIGVMDWLGQRTLALLARLRQGAGAAVERYQQERQEPADAPTVETEYREPLRPLQRKVRIEPKVELQAVSEELPWAAERPAPKLAAVAPAVDEVLELPPGVHLDEPADNRPGFLLGARPEAPPERIDFDRPPGVELLDLPSRLVASRSEAELEAIARLVEEKLRDFRIEVEVVAVSPGPVITRFEMRPAPGVKVSQISNLAKDLARALSVTSVRIVEVIPGKSTVGLEIPNEERELVLLRELIESDEYQKAGSPLTLVLGKDISGRPVVADLARMPHLLVAGTTGSGKSVGVNAMIVSILYRAMPDEVRFIMIDPKMLELSVYQDIRHLLAPVVTDMKDAANALRWCVAEMERRYKLMSALGVRNLAGFNSKVREARASGQPLTDPLADPALTALGEAPLLDTLPFIVVVVDEFADLMMIVGKKVEELIARLAQKARAAGIHLILATQRPSVDVITGLIKANIPTRIAFQVSSKVDSRTILDQNGAEHLLGHGDMLYLPPGSGHPVRIHGAFVSDEEVHRVVHHLHQQGSPDYIDEVLAGGSEGEGNFSPDGSSNEETDALYDHAVRLVAESRRGSVSWVQRKLKIGYNRAARIVEQMESDGIVGEAQSNGMREVLIPPPQE